MMCLNFDQFGPPGKVHGGAAAGAGTYFLIVCSFEFLKKKQVNVFGEVLLRIQYTDMYLNLLLPCL